MIAGVIIVGVIISSAVIAFRLSWPLVFVENGPAKCSQTARARSRLRRLHSLLGSLALEVVVWMAYSLALVGVSVGVIAAVIGGWIVGMVTVKFATRKRSSRPPLHDGSLEPLLHDGYLEPGIYSRAPA